MICLVCRPHRHESVRRYGTVTHFLTLFGVQDGVQILFCCFSFYTSRLIRLAGDNDCGGNSVDEDDEKDHDKENDNEEDVMMQALEKNLRRSQEEVLF